MVESLIVFLQTNVLPWGVLGVFVASIVEEVFAPIPSALIMAMSGFLFVVGPFSVKVLLALLFKVALPAALGVTLGSYPIYFIARYGGRRIIDSWGKYFGLYWADIEKLENRLKSTKKDELLIGIARVLPIVPSVAISAFCGILQIKLLRYSLISFIGVFVRAVIIGVIGWQAGNVYQKYTHLIGEIENYILYTIVVMIIGFIVLKYRKSACEKKPCK